MSQEIHNDGEEVLTEVLHEDACKMSQEIHDEEIVAEGLDDEDEWMNCMKERLVSEREDGPFHREHLIYRVHSSLRNENPSCYEPIATSIGPYHHGKKHLLAMETLKKQYFRDLLRRNGDDRFEDLVKQMKDSEDRARGCYPEKIELESKAFIEMMLLDGCFIVEFLLKCGEGHGKGNHDQPFDGPGWRLYTLHHRDLLLFENQLPFFLLQEIFQIVMPNETDPKQALVTLFLKLLESINLIKPPKQVEPSILESVYHLLHLWHTHLIPPSEQNQDSKIRKSNNSALCLGMCNCWKGKTLELKRCVWMPSVTELKESKIKFKASSSNLLEINFCKGEMIIPMLYVQDNTETQLRNLIAFEQCCLKPSSRDYYFTSYSSFLNLLINTSKDVEILHREGILMHWLGEDEEVAQLFNKLAKGVFVDLNESYLANTFKRVNEYRSRMHCARLLGRSLCYCCRLCYHVSRCIIGNGGSQT